MNILIAGFEVMNDSTSFWTDIFTKYFIDPSKLPDDQRDDMLFYVRKTHNPKNKSFTFRVSPALMVCLNDKMYMYMPDWVLICETHW